MNKLEAANQLAKAGYLNLSKNPSRQNKRRIDREFIDFLKKNNISPFEFVQYLENNHNDGGEIPVRADKD